MNQEKRTKPVPPDDGNDADANPAAANTPGTDMQPEDAGTAESGNEERGSAAEKAMKQTARTPAERGDR